MNIGRTMAVAAVLVVAACCAGCRDDVSPGGEPVVVALYTLSGSEASTGQDLRQGVKLALEVVNESLDLPLPMARGRGLPRHGTPLKVVFADCKGDPDLAARLVEEHAARGATAFMGCYSSAITDVASRRAEGLGIPFLNAASTAPVLTRRGFRWFFRTTPDDAMFAAMLFDFLDGVTGSDPLPGGLAVVYENGLWGTGVSREEMRQARRRGYAIAADVPYSIAGLDAQEVAARVCGSGPSVVMQASYATDAVALVRAMGVPDGCLGIIGMNAGFIDPRFVSELGPLAEGVLSREVFALDLAAGKPAVAAVNALFRDRFGRDMTGNSARSLMGLLVLADALDRAASFEPMDVRRALAATDIPSGEVPLPWGGVRFNRQTGQNVLGSGVVVQVQDGAYVTVWPPEAAAADPVWPRRARGGDGGRGASHGRP